MKDGSGVCEGVLSNLVVRIDFLLASLIFCSICNSSSVGVTDRDGD